ncbi:hypothetical protein ACVGVM_05880 [Pseudonocardia bannensis]|uniref:PH domain-containing protein n=1 Tax=Pseudonocardia bannensis TaxID=630973 RepID=A0A848DBZ7_9PSEU|nr:hypothetical protein [Pseudonocardia bannensis]NMH90248.1 hypothetical protein [Pseudonocardia bannensis]
MALSILVAWTGVVSLARGPEGTVIGSGLLLVAAALLAASGLGVLRLARSAPGRVVVRRCRSEWSGEPALVVPADAGSVLAGALPGTVLTGAGLLVVVAGSGASRFVGVGMAAAGVALTAFALRDARRPRGLVLTASGVEFHRGRTGTAVAWEDVDGVATRAPYRSLIVQLSAPSVLRRKGRADTWTPHGVLPGEGGLNVPMEALRADPAVVHRLLTLYLRDAVARAEIGTQASQDGIARGDLCPGPA